MQFIQMAQAVRKLVGLQGSGPSSVDATGVEGMFIELVKTSWKDIQNSRSKWKWMRDEKTFSMVVGTTAYTPATVFGPVNRFKHWYKDTFFVTVGGQKTPLRFVEFDTFRDRHINDTTNAPIYDFTIRPKDSALIFTPPDSTYTITCCYHKSNQDLSAATDIPELPEDFHLVIVYKAVASYALSMAISHIYQEYSMEYNKLYGSLLRDQLPRDIFKIKGIV